LTNLFDTNYSQALQYSGADRSLTFGFKKVY